MRSTVSWRACATHIPAAGKFANQSPRIHAQEIGKTIVDWCILQVYLLSIIFYACRIFEPVIPDYPVSCKRLIPGSGYLKAICEDNVGVFDTPVKLFCHICRSSLSQHLLKRLLLLESRPLMGNAGISTSSSVRLASIKYNHPFRSC